MKPIWMKLWIPVLALLLILGCGEEPDRKIEGAVDLSEIGTAGAAPNQDSGTQTARPLTDQQLAEGSGTNIDGHPPVTEDQKNVHREIVMPKSVEGKWKAVKTHRFIILSNMFGFYVAFNTCIRYIFKHV